MKKRLKKLAAIGSVAAFLIPNYALAFAVDFAPGTPLVEALRALGYKAKKSIVIDGDLTGTVALHMDDTTFENAIKMLSMTKGFNYEIQDDIVLVGSQKAMNSIETFQLHHIDPDSAAKQLAVLVEDDKDVVVNKENHAITVLGNSTVLDRVRAQLKKIDVAQQQVTIRAEVIELSNNKGRDVGLNWSTDSWTKDTSSGTNDGFKYTILGKHEETKARGKVLARPSITTFDGNKATILMGDKVPVFTSTQTSTSSSDNNNSGTVTVEYKDVGVKLEVEPYVNDLKKGLVTMAIKPSVSVISEWVESGNNKAPQISERSAETKVRVKSGQTILIGGLLRDEEIKSLKAVPLLSKIPILGEIFKSRSLSRKSTEIIIAITPTILTDEEGKPQVEKQRLSPKLRDAMNNIKGEESEYNKQDKDKALNLEENARLKKELAKLKKQEAKRQAAAKKMEKEIRENNRVLKEAIKQAKRGQYYGYQEFQ